MVDDLVRVHLFTGGGGGGGEQSFKCAILVYRHGNDLRSARTWNRYNIFIITKNKRKPNSQNISFGFFLCKWFRVKEEVRYIVYEQLYSSLSYLLLKEVVRTVTALTRDNQSIGKAFSSSWILNMSFTQCRISSAFLFLLGGAGRRVGWMNPSILLFFVWSI